MQKRNTLRHIFGRRFVDCLASRLYYTINLDSKKKLYTFIKSTNKNMRINRKNHIITGRSTMYYEIA